MTLERLGAYRIEGVLGAGGMGTVYRGRAADGAAVAVKVLRSDIGDEALARFRREAEIRLDHPNVVRTLDSGEQDGRPFIVLELLEGESLSERLERGTMRPAEVVDVLVQACEGLAAAHARGIVHRDLKPGNLFCCSDGCVKVLDFGVAHLVSRTDLTVTGTVLGTPAFLSPEQARGVRDLDLRTDIWALGGVAWRALTGVAPFDRGTPYATLLAILMEPLPSLRSRAGDVPPALADVIERCLEKKREERWSAVGALREALATVNLTASLPPPPTDEPLPAGEERIVAVLLARGVVDVPAVQEAIAERGGRALVLLEEDVIGLFGAERSEGDEAACAVLAALDCRHLADHVSVGSGRARSARGEVAGTAVRAAEAGCTRDVIGVAVDQSTVGLLGARFTMEPLEEGFAEVVAEQLEDSASAHPAVALGTFGRAAELAALEEAVSEVGGGAGARTLLVTGPPGIGKTQLRHELGRMASAAGFRVLSGAGEPLHRETALSLFRSVLQHRVRRATQQERWPRIDRYAPPTERRQAAVRLAREAIEGTREARDAAQFLGELCGVDMPQTPELRAARQDAQLMGDRLRLALKDYVAGMCSRGPLLLVLEDLHWADDASIDLLGSLLERASAAPLLVFASCRAESAERIERVLRPDGVRRIELRGLCEQAVGEMGASVAGAPIPEGVVLSIAQATDGNPLFVEQIMRALAAGNLADDEVGGLPLPLTVEAAVQSRLDHLPSEEKELCKRAAILGRPFSVDEIDAIGVARAGALLGSLHDRDLLQQQPGKAERRSYAFRSSVTREVAYRMMTAEVRSELHRRAAAALVHTADPEELAAHHESGGQLERAAEHYAVAALAASRRGDSASVVRFAGKAIELGAPASERFELHFARADSLRFLGRRDEQARDLELALSQASDDRQRARTLTERGAWLARAGRMDEALAVGADAERAATSSEDDDVRTFAAVRLAESLAQAGRFEDARAALGRAEALVRSGADWLAAKVAASHAFVAATAGDVGGARAAYARAVSLHRAAGDTRRAVFNEQNLADCYNRVGAHGDAAEALVGALEGTRRVGNRLAEGYVLANLGYALAKQGHPEEALTRLDEALDRAKALGDARLALAVAVYRARALLLLDRPSEARAAAEQAMVDAETTGPKWLGAVATSLAARAWLLEGDTDAALGLAERAERIRADLGGIEEDEGDIFLTHAQALVAAGRRDEAEAVRAEGRARVEALAARIKDEDWRRRFRQDVEPHRLLLGDAPLC